MKRASENVLAGSQVARLIRPMLIARHIPAIQICFGALWRARAEIGICFAMASLVSTVVVAIYAELYIGRFHSCSQPSTSASNCLGVFVRTALQTPSIPSALSSSSALTQSERLTSLPILVPMAWNAAKMVDFDIPLHNLQTIALIACPFSQGWAELAETFTCVKGQGIGVGVQNWVASFPLMIAVVGSFCLCCDAYTHTHTQDKRMKCARKSDVV